jgi:hypothetical protein
MSGEQVALAYQRLRFIFELFSFFLFFSVPRCFVSPSSLFLLLPHFPSLSPCHATGSHTHILSLRTHTRNILRTYLPRHLPTTVHTLGFFPHLFFFFLSFFSLVLRTRHPVMWPGFRVYSRRGLGRVEGRRGSTWPAGHPQGPDDWDSSCRGTLPHPPPTCSFFFASVSF